MIVSTFPPRPNGCDNLAAAYRRQRLLAHVRQDMDIRLAVTGLFIQVDRDPPQRHHAAVRVLDLDLLLVNVARLRRAYVATFSPP